MKCQQFYAKKDGNGFPIPGTMMGFRSKPGSCGFDSCQLVELPAVTPVPGANQVRSFHPTGLRFFVSLNSRGQIIPNSLTSSLVQPKGRRTAEFIKIVNI